MNSLTVTDPQIGTIRIEHTPFSIELDIEGKRTDVSWRFFLPPTVNGQTVEDFAGELLSDCIETADDEATRKAYEDAQVLMWVHEMLPTTDTRRRKRFNPNSFGRAPTLIELTKSTCTRHRPLHEQLLAVTGGVDVPSDELLNRAIYERPTIYLPYHLPEYERFREMFLKEFRTTIRGIQEAADAALAEAHDKNPESPRTLADERAQFLFPLMNQQLRQIFRTANRMEATRAKQFADLVGRVETLLHTRVAAEAERRQVTLATPEGEEASPGLVALVEEMVTADEANALLDDFIARMEAVYPGLVEKVEPAGTEVQEDISFEAGCYLALVAARKCRSVYEKCCVLDDVRCESVNRAECLRLLQRQAEDAYTRMVGHAYRLVYQALRGQLTWHEQRAFRLLYLPQAFLGGKIAMLDPVIRSFILHTDAETLGLLAVAFVLGPVAGEVARQAREEVSRRWAAFLRFYPFWVEAVRSDETEGRRRRKSHGRIRSLDEPDERGKKSQVADPKVMSQDDALAQSITAVLGGRLVDLAARYCTRTEARYIERYVSDEKTESQIAQEFGVTQQAVNKAIQRGVRRLREGLLSDGVISADEVA